jgi:hypothetical protein
MRSAVSELSRSLARLFEMIRTDRHEQRGRISQLERELAAVRQQLASLGVEPVAAPAPNDFDQLRAAAERLRVRTEQLVRDAGDAHTRSVGLAGDPSTQATHLDEPASDAAGAPAASDAERETTETAQPESELGGRAEEANGPSAVSHVPDEVDEEPAELGVSVLRVIDGAVDAPDAPAAEQGPAGDLEVESELPLARAVALGRPSEPAAEGPAPETDPTPADASRTAPAAAAPTAPASPEPEPVIEPPARPASRPEPVAIEPRAAYKRRRGVRRRRVDARKLVGVEPTAALGSMVGAVDALWTAGCAVDLVVAFTDGGALRVSGGDRTSLRIEEVEPGTPARCTITATRRQLIPLFGRLELTAEESAPLIHGSRRDADLLVGWFDRAQRLPVEPL